jgi:ubiquinone/menaquinone biosynthesis C-methylase UbiE
MNIDSLRKQIGHLCQSMDSLAAIALALDATSDDKPLPPHANRVIEAMGMKDAIAWAEPQAVRSMRAQIIAFMLTSARMIEGPGEQGWTFTNAAVLQAAGDVSAAVPGLMKRKVVPELEGLAARLNAAGAAFLEVGIGVAAMAVEMARLWPELRIVGLEPLAEARALAQQRIEAGHLGHRINLHSARIEHFEAQDEFDLAWLPSLFIPPHAIMIALASIKAALKSGGWLLMPVLKSNDDALATALSQFRAACFGGFTGTAEDAKAMLIAQGFHQVRALPSEPSSLTCFVVGRK